MNASRDAGNAPENASLENGTSTNQHPDLYVIAVVEIATLAVIFVASILGNVGMLIALYARRRRDKKKKFSRIYFFILHLTLADLVTAMLNILPQLLWKVTYRFAGGPALCKTVRFGQTLGPYAISYILVATTIDRYRAICSPLTYRSWSSRRSRTMVGLAWVISLVFSVPQVTIFSYQEVGPAVHDCWASFHEPWGERVYVTWYSVSVFIAPLCVLVGAYARICRRVWRSARSPAQRHQDRAFLSRAKINTVMQTVAVIVVYIACSTPFICALLWAAWDRDNYYSPLWTGSTLTLLTLLSSMNSCVNPWVYLAFNPELVRTLCAMCRNRGGSECHASRASVASRASEMAELNVSRQLTAIPESEVGDELL